MQSLQKVLCGGERIFSELWYKDGSCISWSCSQRALVYGVVQQVTYSDVHDRRMLFLIMHTDFPSFLESFEDILHCFSFLLWPSTNFKWEMLLPSYSMYPSQIPVFELFQFAWIFVLFMRLGKAAVSWMMEHASTYGITVYHSCFINVCSHELYRKPGLFSYFH